MACHFTRLRKQARSGALGTHRVEKTGEVRVDQLTIGATGALAVAISTAAIYLVCVGLLRLLGQRTLTAMSLSDLAGLLATGAVVGRTTLLATPTLGSGIVALATLFAMQRLFRVLRRGRRARALLDHPSVLLLRDGRCDPVALRRAGVTTDDLRQRLRLAGISRWDQVGRVILERSGEISVVRRDPGLDEDLFADVADSSPAPRPSSVPPDHRAAPRAD